MSYIGELFWGTPAVLINVTVPLWLFIAGISIIFVAMFLLFSAKCRVHKNNSEKLNTDIKNLKEQTFKSSEELNQKQKKLQNQNEQISQQNIELEMHRHQLEKLVNERTKELIIAKDKAEESDKLKGAFLENMSHEIRTPMNAILGFINLLDNPLLEEKTRKYYINYINQSGKVLLRLIDDIIDFARLETGQVYVDKRKCNINKLCGNIISNYRKRASTEKPKISILLESPDEEIESSTDCNRLTQVINHLLDNAYKFTNSGYIKLIYERKGDRIYFNVEDTGIGIPEQYLDRIFDRFFKIENDSSRLFRGAGLGLSISRSLIQLLDGEISLQSEPGKGSVFSFYIAYKPFETISDNQQTKKPINYIWDDKTFLVAEDEDTNYHFIEAVLKKTGVRLIRAENGVELLELFEKHPNVDIILLDIKMPSMDGFHALKILRDTSKEIPILAQTAYNSPNDRKKCLELGCNDFIAKPIPHHLLLEKINKLLRISDKPGK